MNRPTIWTLILSLALVSAAEAAPTAEQKCQAAKLNAIRGRRACIAAERRKAVLGKTPDVAKCEASFAKAIAASDKAAARKGVSCRWLDEGDGTATDLNSGLQWELKTDDGSVHDKDNTYAWNTTFPGTEPNGTVFTSFLASLNGGVSGDGSTTTGCFADHCDWRLPTIAELRSTLDAQYPDCTSNPCTSIPGHVIGSFYWSSSTQSDLLAYAYYVYVWTGLVDFANKDLATYVRAVRGD